MRITNVPTTSSGKLWNITSKASKETFYFDNMIGNSSNDNNPYLIEMEIKPIKGINPGNYTITIGARFESVTYSKIVDLIVRE